MMLYGHTVALIHREVAFSPLQHRHSPRLMASCVFRLVVVLIWLLLSCSVLHVGSFDWIRFLNRAGNVLHAIERSTLLQQLRRIDFTSGAGTLSYPADYDISERSGDGVSLGEDLMELQSTLPAIMKLQDMTIEQQTGLVKIHQVGRSMTKKFPDGILLGALALISTELIQREVTRNVHVLPPVMRELANRTMGELDEKLELLTAMQWKLEPFLQGEMGNLQTQPAELIDRYLLGDILLRIDKDISPVLSKLIADPTKVKEVTKRVKEVVQVVTVLLLQPSKTIKSKFNIYNNNDKDFRNRNNDGGPSLEATSSPTVERASTLLLETVEALGLNIETAVLEWNRIIDEVSRLVKSEAPLQYLLSRYSNTNGYSNGNDSGVNISSITSARTLSTRVDRDAESGVRGAMMPSTVPPDTTDTERKDRILLGHDQPPSRHLKRSHRKQRKQHVDDGGRESLLWQHIQLPSSLTSFFLRPSPPLQLKRKTATPSSVSSSVSEHEEDAEGADREKGGLD